MFSFNQRQLLREEAQVGSEGGGEKPPVFDPAAFQTTLLAEIDKRVNGLDKKYKASFDGFKTTLETYRPKAEEPHVEDPKTGEKGPDLEKIAQQRRIDALEKRDAEREKTTAERERKAEEKERYSDIRAKLGGMQLAGDAEIETAFRLFRDEVRRDEEGGLIAGPDGEPFDKYMARQIQTVYPFLLPSRNVGGAGAAKGGNTANGVFDIDKINPNMSKEDRAAAHRALRQATG